MSFLTYTPDSHSSRFSNTLWNHHELCYGTIDSDSCKLLLCHTQLHSASITATLQIRKLFSELLQNEWLSRFLKPSATLSLNIEAFVLNPCCLPSISISPDRTSKKSARQNVSSVSSEYNTRTSIGEKCRYPFISESLSLKLMSEREVG